ncbi:MAG TPA: lipid-A-disaccharide synthase [Vicinamibacterales bacterium]|nr:lipid-A-disaccharide synthase [Vicinamibacterales bacterium]
MTRSIDVARADPATDSSRPRRVMISCGEASGDLYAAALVDALRASEPHVETFGFGGPRLAAAGADLVGNFLGFSVTGLAEAVSVLPRSWRMIRRLGEAARERRPDVFVAVDFPDFNFRLLPILHGLGVPIVYYVSPQLWAWRPGRLHTIARYVTEMLVIFPFEVEIYERAGVPVTLVGHPLADLAVVRTPRDEWMAQIGLNPARPLVALLPGSRPNEVRRILPVLAQAASIIHREVPDVQFVVARAPSLEERLFLPLERLRAASIPIVVVEQAADEAMAAASVVITASGTATVQAAMHGRPMVIVYGVSPLTYAIGRRFVKVPHYGMVNLVAGRRIVPELIQERFTPDHVARETVSLLRDPSRADAMRADLAAVREALGGRGASMRAAQAVWRVATKGSRS